MTTHEKIAHEIVEALLEDLRHRGGHSRVLHDSTDEAKAGMRQAWHEIVTEKLNVGGAA